MLRVKLKWNKQIFDPFEISPDESFLSIKSKVHQLTQVPIDKQKLLFKGRILKNEETPRNSGLEPESQLVLVGSASAPAQSGPKPEEEKKESIVPGLNNIGNTSYINAAVQMVRKIPELAEAFGAYGGSELPKYVREVVECLNRPSGPHVTPSQLIGKVHMSLPQFATRDQSGRLLSQDLAGFLSSFLPAFGSLLPVITPAGTESNVYKAVFEVGVETVVQKDAGISDTRSEHLPLLPAILDGTDSLEGGIQAYLGDKGRIVNLPAYLWVVAKERGAFPVKKAQWTNSLDLTPFCSERLQQSLREEVKELPLGDLGLEAGRSTGKYRLVGVVTVDGEKAETSDYSVWLPGKEDGWTKIHDTVVTHPRTCEERAYIFLYAQSS